jgi:hypothetical protein
MYKNAEQRTGVHHCLVGAPNPARTPCSAGEVIQRRQIADLVRLCAR